MRTESMLRTVWRVDDVHRRVGAMNLEVRRSNKASLRRSGPNRRPAVISSTRRAVAASRASNGRNSNALCCRRLSS